ncbi:MAG: PH domain-containing protein [Phycisphaeraceae bacterium]|nr:PH domain-containing protein [Phycisphaeraceae bacterium]
MGILSGALGNASEIPVDKIKSEYGPMLIESETILKAFKVIRDTMIFTNKRVLLVDKQGVTGTRAEYMTVPYTRINRFAKESAGVLDIDASLKIWVTGQSDPLVIDFKRNNAINEIYQLLSEQVLK